MNYYLLLYLLYLVQYGVCIKVRNEFDLFEPRLINQDGRDYDATPRQRKEDSKDIYEVSLKHIEFKELTENFFTTDIPIRTIEDYSHLQENDVFKKIGHFRLSEFGDPRDKSFFNLFQKPRKYRFIQPISEAESTSKDIKAYWSPGHSYVDIPIEPKSTEPHYVFTQSFSGCSLVVDRMPNFYRVYHVWSGYEDKEYNNLKDHGYGMAASIGYEHYGTYRDTIKKTYFQNIDFQNIENRYGNIFMVFNKERKKWQIHAQNIDVDGENGAFNIVPSSSRDGVPSKMKIRFAETISVGKQTLMTVESGTLPQDEKIHPRKDITFTNCVAGVHRSSNRAKRSTINTKCFFNEHDVEQFSRKKIDPHKLQSPNEINVDSEKFFKFIKSSPSIEKNAQLIQMFQNNKQIQTYIEKNRMLKEVIDSHGFDQSQKKQRLNQLSDELLISGQNKHLLNDVSFKNSLVSAYGKLMLMNGIKGVIVTCSENGSAIDCGMGVAGTAWSLIAHKIENILVKSAPQFTKIISAKLISSRLLPANSKFAVHFIGARYGAKLVHGTIVGASAVFDIYDMTMSSKNLIDCVNRKNTTNPCSDKEIRDSIAALSFSGASFVSGIAFTGPVGLVVASALIVGQGVYNGVSTVIEYKDNYHTTDSENWNIFWKTFMGEAMDDDIEELVARYIQIEHKAAEIWSFLNKTPENVFACGMGLGYLYHDISLLPDHAKIILNAENPIYSTELTRAIPKEIADATMLCLPHYTNTSFENGVRGKLSTAVYYCENAMVIADNRRIENGDSVLFFLKDVSSGQVIGSNKYRNLFFIYKGFTEIFGGNSTSNKFMLFSPLFTSRLVGGENSTNIIDVSRMTNYSHTIRAEFEQRSCIGGRIKAKLNNVEMLNDRINLKNSIYIYIGRTKVLDTVSCFTECNSPRLLINSGGGADRYNMDVVENCKQVVLSPFTRMMGKTSIYYKVYVNAPDDEYTGHNLQSSIDVSIGSQVILVFPQSELLDDNVQFTYTPLTNSLIIKMNDGNRTFAIELKRYLSVVSQGSMFSIFDQNGSNIIPRIQQQQNETIPIEIEFFELHTECRNNCIEFVNKPSLIRKNATKKQILSTIKNLDSKETFILGSRFSDVIYMNEETLLARGQEGSDIYILDDSRNKKKNYLIDNMADDQNLDIVSMSAIPKKYQIKGCNLHVTVNDDNFVQLTNYFLSVSHRHVIFTNDANEAFIPNAFFTKPVSADDENCLQAIRAMAQEASYIEKDEKKMSSIEQYSGYFVRFIHATETQNTFLFTKNFTEDDIVIDAIVDDLHLYKDYDDLIIIRENNETNSLIIKFQDFFIDRAKWDGINVMLYDKGVFSQWSGLVFGNDDDIVTLEEKISDAYKNVFEEYTTNFTSREQQIHRTNVDQRQRIAILVIKNFLPNRIEVKRDGRHLENLLLINTETKHIIRIENWDTDKSYRIPIFEFHFDDFETITIRNLDRFTTQDYKEIQDLLKKASDSYNIRHSITVAAEIGAKCSISLDTLQRKENAYYCAGFLSLADQTNFIRKYCGIEELVEFRENTTVKQAMDAMNSLIIDATLNGYITQSKQCTDKYFQRSIKSQVISSAVSPNDYEVNFINDLYYIAVKEGDLNTIRSFFSNYTNMERDNDGCISIHWAAKFGKINVAKYIIGKKLFFV